MSLAGDLQMTEGGLGVSFSSLSLLITLLQSPEYTIHAIPQTYLSTYALRSHAVVGRINARTERFQSSFYQNCLQEWNSLASEIK